MGFPNFETFPYIACLNHTFTWLNTPAQLCPAPTHIGLAHDFLWHGTATPCSDLERTSGNFTSKLSSLQRMKSVSGSPTLVKAVPKDMPCCAAGDPFGACRSRDSFLVRAYSSLRTHFGGRFQANQKDNHPFCPRYFFSPSRERIPFRSQAPCAPLKGVKSAVRQNQWDSAPQVGSPNLWVKIKPPRNGRQEFWSMFSFTKPFGVHILTHSQMKGPDLGTCSLGLVQPNYLTGVVDRRRRRRPERCPSCRPRSTFSCVFGLSHFGFPSARLVPSSVRSFRTTKSPPCGEDAVEFLPVRWKGGGTRANLSRTGNIAQR